MPAKIAVLLLLLPWTPIAEARPDEGRDESPPMPNRFATMTPEEERAALAAARSWAKVIAKEDQGRYATALQSALLRIQAGTSVDVNTRPPSTGPGGALDARVPPGDAAGIPTLPPGPANEDLDPGARARLNEAARQFSEVVAAGRFAAPTGGHRGMAPGGESHPEAFDPDPAFFPGGERRITFDLPGGWPKTKALDDRGIQLLRDSQRSSGRGMLTDNFPEMVRGGDITQYGPPPRLSASPSGRPYGGIEVMGRGVRVPSPVLPSGDPSLWALRHGDTDFARMLDARGLTRDQAAMVLSDRTSSDAPSWNSLLATDARWIRNFQAWLALRSPPYPGLRVLGGHRAAPDEFPCVVAISESSDFRTNLGSGILISPNVILTAGHVISDDLLDPASGGVQYVWIGTQTNSTGYAAKAVRGRRHPEYSRISDAETQNDIGLLILERRVEDIAWPAFATAAEIEASPALSLVGYGLTRQARSGYRQVGTVFIGSTDFNRYGSFDYELVAGAENVDSCHGDSGGGCFVPYLDDRSQLRYKLAAVISRSYVGGPQCGAGGMYVRVDKKLVDEGLSEGGWAREFLVSNGGAIPGINPRVPPTASSVPSRLPSTRPREGTKTP